MVTTSRPSTSLGTMCCRSACSFLAADKNIFSSCPNFDFRYNGAWDLLIQNWFYKKSKGRQCKGRRPRNFDFFSWSSMPIIWHHDILTGPPWPPNMHCKSLNTKDWRSAKTSVIFQLTHEESYHAILNCLHHQELEEARRLAAELSRLSAMNDELAATETRLHLLSSNLGQLVRSF